MSLRLTVHVGPYAEFLVPEGQAVNHQRLEEAQEMAEFNHNLETQERVVVNGVVCERACYAPYFGKYSKPELKPPRQMHWSGDVWVSDHGVQDLTEVSMADEIAWFARVHAVALKALEEGYGVAPRLRWGVLPCVS